MLYKIVIKLTYFVLGSILIIAGLIALFNPTISIPKVESLSVVESVYVSKLKRDIAHITMEISTMTLTFGGLFIWSAFNFSKAKILDYFFLFFFLLFALIHWYEFINGNTVFNSPLINSIPFVLMLVLVLVKFKKRN